MCFFAICCESGAEDEHSRPTSRVRRAGDLLCDHFYISRLTKQDGESLKNPGRLGLHAYEDCYLESHHYTMDKKLYIFHPALLRWSTSNESQATCMKFRNRGRLDSLRRFMTNDTCNFKGLDILCRWQMQV
jgi:hypothetical protein